jgi:NADH-quinone oxidoreductase subunit J
MLQDAQFLAAATVIVYAGAIVVMFLFVIMLAQQAGTARHDRLSREPGLAVAAAFVLLVAMVSTIFATYHDAPAALADRFGPPLSSAAARLDSDPRGPHVAALGTALFTDHWLSLEVAGTLLLVAMVAAIAIAARRERT